MENMEGLMRSLCLSEEEQRRVKVVLRKRVTGAVAEAKAVGKVMTEKPIYAEGLATALGRAWCPLKGIRCKSMGGNVFLFTFLQDSGKHKALKGGPWMMNNDLIVLEEYDPMKRIGEYSFDSVPIWIRVFRLPLGSMDREVGEVMEVEVGDDDRAKGEYLRVKVRIDINKPLMRGMIMQFGEKGKEEWCPFEYEYLPKFCYTCGIIGHEAKECAVKSARGEKQQYGPWLRAYIPKKSVSSETRRWNEGRSGQSYRSSGVLIRDGRAGSNSKSWRKDNVNRNDGGASNDRSLSDKSEDVTSPLKELPMEIKDRGVNAQRKLGFSTEKEGIVLHVRI
ncbi:hypothetical protein D1007_04663 [Hordeum vulgare]|nr:hypothetical protein D1007_04663 [Hordeum vulgare]